MNATKTTHLLNRQQQQESLRVSICELLQITDLEYGQLVFIEGINYLKAYIPTIDLNKEVKDQDYWISKIIKTKSFWQWWRNHWMNRNEAFLDSIDYQLSLDLMRRIYCDMNSGKDMVKSYHPHRKVLEDTYDEMVQEMVKEEKEKLKLVDSI